MIPTRWLCALLAAAPLATRAATCELQIPEFAFGAYDTSALAPTDSSALLGLSCTGDGSSETVSYSISASAGSGGSASQREMGGTGDTLRYNLFIDGNHLRVWGDGSDGSESIDGNLDLPGSGNASHALFGRIIAGQNVMAGSYSDQLMIQVVY